MVSVSLKDQVARDLRKSLGHLDYSYQKVRHFEFDGHELSEAELCQIPYDYILRTSYPSVAGERGITAACGRGSGGKREDNRRVG